MLYVYEKTTDNFNTARPINIIHPYYASVTIEYDGDYYIEIESPVSEVDLLAEGMIVSCDVPWAGNDLFRIENPVCTGFKVKAKARHLTFDTDRYVIHSLTMTNKTLSQMLALLPNSFDAYSQVIFSTALTTPAISIALLNVTLSEAIEQIRALFDVHLYRYQNEIRFVYEDELGSDEGVTLEYGKNIQEFQVEENWDDVCNVLLPIGKDGITLSPPYVSSITEYDIPYSKIVEFKDAATSAALTTAANKYLAEHNTPVINFKVGAYLQSRTDIGDTIKVNYSPLNKMFTTYVRKIKWSATDERYTNVEFGNQLKSIRGLYKDLKG